MRQLEVFTYSISIADLLILLNLKKPSHKTNVIFIFETGFLIHHYENRICKGKYPGSEIGTPA